MKNLICGIYGDRQFDKTGVNTHHNLEKYSHEFYILDYCGICGMSNFDQNGVETHDAFMDHEFVSEHITKAEIRKERLNFFFKCAGVGIGISVIILGILNLLK